MLNEKIAELLNQQINKEFYSAYLYLDFSNYFYDAGLDGFGNWYKIQAQEERDHAMLILRYMQMNGMKVTLDAIEKPSVELTSNLGVFNIFPVFLFVTTLTFSNEKYFPVLSVFLAITAQSGL